MPRAPALSPSSSSMSVASKGSCAPPSSARRAPPSAARCGRCPPGLPGRRRALLTTTPTRRTTMTMEITPDLVRRLKRLRLGGLLPTLPDRLALRLAAAGFDELVSVEQIVWDTPVSYDRPRVRELFALQWLAEHENVIFCGPVGVGKSFLAQALGHSACRAGHRVRYVKVATLLQA